MNDPFHYPPELLQLLTDTIPRLCRSKKDVLLFFRGAGTPQSLLMDLAARVDDNPDSISKFEIARTVLTRLNEGGDSALRQRRETVKRVVEFEDYSTCWPSDVLKARGLVAEIRRVVNVKDSFTRMKLEREAELKKHRETREAEAARIRSRIKTLDELRSRFGRLFSILIPQERGKALESFLNDLFRFHGILVREAFTRVGDPGEGVIEQIDGVIEVDGHIYLVEMKWLKESVGANDVAGYLVRVYGRGAARGLFIAATPYTPAASKACIEALSQKVVTLCSLQELSWLLENDKPLVGFLRLKVHGAIVDKDPNASVLSML